MAAFDIDRPVSAASGSCDVDDSCTWGRDGSVVHRGVEAGIAARFGAWSVGGGAMALHARREDSATASLNGLRPTNVPAYTLKLQLGYRVASVPGLELLANGLYESDRIVMPDNSLSIPSVARLDLGLRYEQPLGKGTLVWRAGVRERDQRERLARIAVPVRPFVPVPDGAAHLCAVAAGQPVGAERAGYNVRLFLDSSVGRAPDC